MIKDIRVYPWKSSSNKSYIRTKVLTTDASYSVITSLAGDYAGDEIPHSKRAISSIRKNIAGLDEGDWLSIEEMLGGLHESTDIDPGLLLSISLSICKASMQGELWRINEVRQRMLFPKVWLSVIRGRVSDSGSDWKEFMVIPGKVSDMNDMQNQLHNIWSMVGSELKSLGKLAGKDMENRWITGMNTEDTLGLLSKICTDNGMRIGVDCGSWKFEKSHIYNYRNEGKKLNESKQLDFLKEMNDRFNLGYIENPFIPGSVDMLSELKKLTGTEVSVHLRSEPDIKKILESDSISNMNTDTDFFYNYSDMKEFIRLILKKFKKAVFLAPEYAVLDPWVADMSIALKVPYIKAAPIEGNSVLNRLSELWYDVPNEGI